MYILTGRRTNHYKNYRDRVKNSLLINDVILKKRSSNPKEGKQREREEWQSAET